MPSWRKVVASGSDASFSSLTVDTFVSASSFNGSFTGSLQGTASQAISSSYALTASYALISTEPIIVTSPGGIYYINGVAKPVLTFVPGQNYRFDTTAVDGPHPFKFSLTPNGPTQYTYGVTSGPGFIEINVDYATSSSLYYYCTIHSGMGNEANTLRDENLIHNSQTSSMSVLSASYAYTASSATNAAQAISASYAYTASSATNSEQAVSASYAFTASSAISSSYAYTASSATNSNTALTASSANTFLVRNDITASSALITGTLTAQTLVVQTVTSSIVYSSGSNTFGSELTDRQTFTGSVDITGSLSVNGSEAILTNQTASMAVASAVSASYAYTASSAVSASLAQTASYIIAAQTASYVVNAISASYAYTASSAISAYTASSAVSASQSISSSYAYTASSAINASASLIAISSSYALTASYALNAGASSGFPFSGSAEITGSLGVTGSFSVNGNTGQTIFASNADTLVISGSLIVTGSSQVTGSLNVLGGITGSLFGTSSQSVSASYAYTASSAISSSFALTASYALFAANGGGGGVSAIYILDEGVVQGTASYFDFTGAGVTATVNNQTASIYIPGGGGGSNTNSQNAILSQTSPAVTWSFTHNLSTLYPVFTIYDNEDNVIIPQKIHAETTASAFIYFSSARTGTAVASKGGDITSASFAATASLAYNAVSASYAYTASSAVTASFATSAQNASDILVYVKNSSGAQINKGTVVRIVGSVGDNALIATASYTDDNNSANTLGITNQTIANDAFGYVMTEGTLIGIDTTAFTAGQLIYLGLNGAITGSAPVAPLHNVRLGEVLRVQLNNGSIYVRVDNGYEIGEIHDVKDTTTSGSYGDLLVKSGSIWINSKQLTGSYALTGSLTVTGNITAETLVVQTVTSSIIYSSGSNTFGNDLSNRQTFTGSVNITGSAVNLKDGAFSGSGANLFGIPATAITGLNLSQIISGSVSASISPNLGLLINTSVSASNFTGSFTGSLTGIATSASYASFALTSSYSLGGSGFPFSGSAVITGSFLVSQSFVDFSNASYVTGSLTGSLFGTASYATFALSASFAPGFTTNMSQSVAATTWSFTHNLNTITPIVQVYDLTNAQIIPNQIVGMNNSTAEIRFDYAQAGYAVASNGGGLYVTGSTSTLVQTAANVTWSFTHNLNNKYNTYEVYDDSDVVIIPSGIKAVDNNSAEIYFATPQTGRAVAQFSGINGSPNAATASYANTASFVSNLVQNVFITGSLTVTGSAAFTGSLSQNNGFVTLTQVSQSLNYVDDTAAAAGGVPLGGLYRNGNFILIRLS